MKTHLATESASNSPLPESSKHTKSVTGLMIDNLNRTVVSCGLDGKLKVSIGFLSVVPVVHNSLAHGS